MEKYKCLNCKKELKCSCFNLDLDTHHAPFCSAKCLIEWSKKDGDRDWIIDSAENFTYDKEKGWYPLSYKGHFIGCENQFNIKDKELKALIKELQEQRDTWEKLACDYSVKLKRLKKK